MHKINIIVDEIINNTNWKVMEDNHCICGCCHDEYHYVNREEATEFAQNLLVRLGLETSDSIETLDDENSKLTVN